MPRPVRLTLAAALIASAVGVPVGASLAQEAARTAEPSAQTVTIAPKFKKGDVHRFKYHVERKDAHKVTGTEQASDVIVDSELSLTVVDVSDGGASLEFKIESLKVDATTPDGKYAYQSGQPEDDKDRENLALQAFKPLEGMVLAIATDSAGLVTMISGEPAIPQGRSLSGVATQYFTNPDFLKFRWNCVLNARRDRAPTTVGQTWPHSDTFVAMQLGKFEIILNNTLKRVHDGTADIDAVGEMKLSPAKEGDKLAFELKDTSILATSAWSLADGIAKRFEMERQFTLQGNAQGFDVVRTSREKVVFTRVMP